MRIRKHAKISPLIYTHVCQLNQSPWDVITFPVEENEDPLVPPPPLPSSSNYQFDGYADNGTFHDSNGTSQSVTSMKLDETEEFNCSKPEKQHEAAVVESGSPSRRPRAKKSLSSSSSDPYEFYYYSGFGPLWGKKRGARRTDPATSITGNNTEDAEQYSSSQVDNDEFEDDDDEEEKRPRKPIKAKSLKSLM